MVYYVMISSFGMTYFWFENEIFYALFFKRNWYLNIT